MWYIGNMHRHKRTWQRADVFVLAEKPYINGPECGHAELREPCGIRLGDERNDSILKVRGILGIAIARLDGFMLPHESGRVVEVGVDAFGFGFGVVRVVAKKFTGPPM